MCRYAVDLRPMLRVLAGKENLERLLEVDTKVDLKRLRYFYVDEMDAYFVSKVDRDQRHAHRRVSSTIVVCPCLLLHRLFRLSNTSRRSLEFMSRVFD